MTCYRRWIASLFCGLVMVPAVSVGQVYVSAGVGYSTADFSLGSPYNGVVDDRSFLFALDGGFRTERIGIELGLRRYGDFDGRAAPCVPGTECPDVLQSVSSDLSLYKLSLVPRFDVGNVELFGEAGYYRANIDTDIGLPDSDFRKRGLVLGLGARWYFEDPWSVSLRGERFDDDIYQLVVSFGWGLRR
jgi:hypothetical protein